MSLICDVFDMLIVDNETGDVAGSTTLVNANIAVDVPEQEVRSGKGHNLQAILHSGRDISIDCEDTSFRYDWLAKKLGKNVVTGAGVAHTMPTWYQVTTESTAKVITLKNTPINIDTLVIYDAAGIKLVKTIDYTLSTNKVTILKAGILAGNEVEVRTYKYATPATTQTIEIDTTSFPSGCTLVLDTIEIDDDEKPMNQVQFIFPNAKMGGSFTLNTASERNAASQNTTFRIIKPKRSNVIGTVQRIPIVEA